jgi:hypothetical protein
VLPSSSLGRHLLRRRGVKKVKRGGPQVLRGALASFLEAARGLASEPDVLGSAILTGRSFPPVRSELARLDETVRGSSCRAVASTA